LPGVSVSDEKTGSTTSTDSSGFVQFEYQWFPVSLFLTHVGRASVSATILKDSTVIILPINPQSLQVVTVAAYDRTSRANSTADISTVQVLAIAANGNGAYRRQIDVSTATVQTMLEGQAAGLLVTQSTGISGGSSYLTVRGQSSIVNGADPLYVVDGVAAAAGNKSVSTIQSGSSAQSLSPWSLIAPSDIERIDVLKDADATAIYGSRGANGVLLITTKQWKAGLPRWDIAYSAGVSEVLQRTSFMNISQYLAMRREALQNSGLSPDSTNAPDLTILDTTRNIDWGKWLLGRKAPLANINLSCSGGEKFNNYTVGMNSLRESTAFPTQPDHDRLTMNFNYNHLSTDRRWSLRVAGLAGGDVNHQFVTFDPAFFQTLAPDAPPPLNKNGQLNFPPGLFYYNPLSTIRQPYEATSGNYLLSMVNSYAINGHLSFKTTIGINRIQTREFGATPLTSQDPTTSPTAIGFFALTSFDSRVLEPELDYTFKMGKMQTILLGGASFQRLDENTADRTDTGYASDIALLRHEHAIILDTTSQSMRDVYTSFFSSVNFNWSDQFILHLTARRDGSSRFPPGDRWGNFGAGAFAWIFSRSNLMHRLVPFVSYGKIKLSGGVTGNNQMGDRSLQTMPGTSIQSFQSIAGLYPSDPTGIGWEKTDKTELSLDLGFWEDRILFDATAYKHRCDNFLENSAAVMGLANLNSSGPSGSDPSGWPVVLQNSGYELSLSATLVDNHALGWDVSVNWTIPRSKLVSFSQLDNSPYFGRLVIGQSINVLRGYVYTGVDRQTGVYTFSDLNHDGPITEADQKVVGKFNATGFGGFSNNLRWKHFQLQVLLDARIATGLNYLAVVFADNPPGYVGTGLSSNVPTVLLDHWRQPGDRALYQRLTAAPDPKADSALSRYLSSSALLANTSFFRIRKVSFVYDLPAAKAMAMHLTALAFFADAQNLFVFSRYKADAEIQSILTTPTMRTLEAGIRLFL
jgi:TonB-dependent starch-binding outer membrane protein SusC